MSSDRAEGQEGFDRGFHGIPDAEKLAAISFVELAALLSSCEKDSVKFRVIERELTSRLAKDQAKINRFNVILGACIGGAFGLLGVVLGYYLKNDVPPSGVVQKVEKTDLTQKPPLGSVPVGKPGVAASVPNPTPVQGNAQPNNTKP